MASKNTPYGIGLVGLGDISTIHRAGYKKYGLPVVAGFNPSSAAREKFEREELTASVYDNLAELCDDPRVEILDITAPHYLHVRRPIIEKAAALGKPVLIQKPLALSYPEALQLVEILERSGVVGMVNQNMCFTPGALALPPLLIEQKVIGAPFLAQFQMSICSDRSADHWFGKDTRWWTATNTVHHLSVLHFFFGPPQTVYARLGRDPKQPGVPFEGFGNLMLSYPGGLEVALLSTGTYYGTNAKTYIEAEHWIQGPDGVIDWQPEGGFTVSLRADREKPEAERHQHHPTPGNWFPDAFGKCMAYFQAALTAEREPWCSVQDNLYVMAVIEAAYRSQEEDRAISVEEIMGQRYDAAYGPGWTHGFREWQAPEFR